MTRKERVKQLKGNRRQDTTLANLNTGNTRRFTRMIIDNELSSNDEEQRLGAVRKLGKIAGYQTQVDNMINEGVVPALLNILTFDPDPCVQYEAAAAFLNISNGKSNRVVDEFIKHGVIEALVYQLYTCEHVKIKKACVRVLGGITGSRKASIIYLLRGNVLPVLLRAFEQETDIDLKRLLLWPITCLCTSEAPFEFIAPLAPFIIKFISFGDAGVQNTACLLATTLLERESGMIELSNPEFCRSVIALFDNQIAQMQALLAICQLLAGDEAQTEIVLQCGAVIALKRILDSDVKPHVKQYVLMSFANLACGTAEQIEEIFKQGVTESLLRIIAHKNDDVRVAAMVIVNMLYCGTHKQFKQLVEKQCVHALRDLLKDTDCAPDFHALLLEGANLVLDRVLNEPNVDGKNPFEPVLQIISELHLATRFVLPPMNATDVRINRLLLAIVSKLNPQTEIELVKIHKTKQHTSRLRSIIHI